MLSVILAAGKGTRMYSDLPKVLHKVNGKPMIQMVYETARNVGECLFVLGYKKDEIVNKYPEYKYIYQENQLGTARAVKLCVDEISKHDTFFVLYADGPLITKNTLLKMKNKLEKDNLDCLLLSCIVSDPTGYGRIIKENNKLIDIVEEKDATLEQKKICEINTGVCLFRSKSFLDIIDKIENNNANNEYYLTDSINLLYKNGCKLDTYQLENSDEMLGVNNKLQLAEVSNILRQKKLKNLMLNGVEIIDPNNTYIEEDVEIGTNTIIYPNTIITGNSRIGDNCIIYSSRIENSIISSNVKIDNSVIENSNISNFATIGPFAHLRPNSILKDNVHIGNFVEIKNSTLYENVKTGHLTYIGDSEIGKNTNIGAGTITCNYDGHYKHKTIIGENAFIGSNSILIAPIKVGNNVLTAAGSVLTKDVDDNKLAFGRSRQTVIDKK